MSTKTGRVDARALVLIRALARAAAIILDHARDGARTLARGLEADVPGVGVAGAGGPGLGVEDPGMM